MPLLTFPAAPASGQLYPTVPITGQNQYQWDGVDQTWRLLGVATGVTPGCYGDGLNVAAICVDATGRITSATTTPITPITPDLQTVTTQGAVTTDTIDVGGLIAAGLTYPTTDGTSGQVLTTNGAGILSWTSAGGGSVGTLQTVTDNGATTTNPLTVDTNAGPGLTVTDSAVPAWGTTKINSNNINISNGRIQVQTNGQPGVNILGASGPSITIFQGGHITLGTGNPVFSETINLDGGTGEATVQSLTVSSDTTASGKVTINDTGNYSEINFYTSAGTVGAQIQGVEDTLALSATNFATINNYSVFYSSGNVILNNGSQGSTQIMGQLTTGDKVGINGSIGTATLTVNGTTESDTVTTTGNFQVARSGVAAALISGDAGSSYVPTLSIAGLAYPTADGSAGQVLTTDGAGNLGWVTTAEVVAAPTTSADPGTVGQIAFGTGFFYWHDGTQWLRVAGSTF